MDVPPAPWRIVFLSMVLPAVQGLHAGAKAAGHEPVALLSPRRKGLPPEARERYHTLVDDTPEDLDVVLVPSKDRLPRLLRAYEPDLAMCLGYPWLLPKEVLEIPKLGIVNSHPSLLPRYRGPIPIAWAFRNDEPELGLTYHLMDEHFDTGPILAQGRVPIDENDHFPDLLPKIGVLTIELAATVFERLARGDRGEPQPTEGASWAPFFEDDYVHVDWSRPRREIHNQVRAWGMAGPPPARGPLAELDGEQVRLVRTSLAPVEGAREVQAGDGPLWIVESAPA